MSFPIRLNKKINDRADRNALRDLVVGKSLIDFSSNDYLGFATSQLLYEKTHNIVQHLRQKNGATGSRLLTGNHALHDEVEQRLAAFFNAETALLFNSGYDANIGLLSSVLQRGDVIFYDEFIHASIRDGIQMSSAKSIKFKHNNLRDLEEKILRHSEPALSTNRLVSESHHAEFYIITESVFSMDGDSPDLINLSQLCTKYKAHLIVDEAHATGVIGSKGSGLVSQLQLEKEVFARIHTFGKAIGCHGAVVLGSERFRTYLINFARSFIYTTAMPLHNIATIKAAFEQIIKTNEIEILHKNINYFNQQQLTNNNQLNFIKSNSAIHSCIIPGNENVKHVSQILETKGYDVKPILSPTVPKGEERLRICLHSYNSFQEIDNVLAVLTTTL